jgi:broad specificity phosphatase PhoE
MSTITTLYLVRHAESAPDFSITEADWPLSATGRIQAAARWHRDRAYVRPWA